MDDVEDLVEGVSASARNGASTSSEGSNLALLGLEDADSGLDLGDSGFASLDFFSDLRSRMSGSLNLESLES